MRLSLKVVPGSSRNAIVGWMGDTLRVCVTAVPENGRANVAVESLLADALGLPRSGVRVVAGFTAPRKQVEIVGLDAANLRNRLRPLDGKSQATE